MPAQMPPEHISHNTLADMLEGDVRYTVPWAMAVDEDWNAWIDASFTARSAPGGTVTLEVLRDRRGYVVTVRPEDSWQPRWISFDVDWRPVAEILSPSGNPVAPR